MDKVKTEATKFGRPIWLNPVCPKCNFQFESFWVPESDLPYITVMTCPKCQHKEQMKWYDRETIKLLERKKLGLLEDEYNSKRIRLLEKQIKLIEGKYFILQARLELIESKINLSRRSPKTQTIKT